MPKHYVHVSHAAITQMILSGFEAFVVKHGEKKRHALETRASLFGRIEVNRQSVHHYIEFISVDTSAEMTGGSVAERPEAARLKRIMGEAAGFALLGDFHTHPYLPQEMSLSEMRERGCRFSDGDRDVYKEALSDEGADTYFLAGVMGIRNKSQVEEKDLSLKKERNRTELDGLIAENLFEFSLADSKCFLHFQVFELDANGMLVEVPTAIKCDYLEKHAYLAADFGSVAVVKGKKRIVEFKP